MNRIFAISGTGAEKNPDVEPIDIFWSKAIEEIPSIARTIKYDQSVSMKRLLA